MIGRTDGPVVLVATPHDIETLRREDPGAARAWRLAVREVLGGLMGRAPGSRVSPTDGEYVLENRLTGYSTQVSDLCNVALTHVEQGDPHGGIHSDRSCASPTPRRRP